MKITKLLILAVSVLAVQSSFAATFKLENKSDQASLVSACYGRSKTCLSSRSISKDSIGKFDTGNEPVTRIKWTGVNEAGRVGTYLLESANGVLLPAARLNYNFNIFPHGHYSSNFSGGHFESGDAVFIEQR